jgi:hypothetical protein
MGAVGHGRRTASVLNAGSALKRAATARSVGGRLRRHLRELQCSELSLRVGLAFVAAFGRGLPLCLREATQRTTDAVHRTIPRRM